jgi:anaerobic selenocysteine-containing dehydrogenase
VAPICGVEAATLERIARELAQTRPAFVITDARATQASNGLQIAMAVNALNALLGSLERPGGVLVQREAPLAPWPPLAADVVAEAGLRAPRVDGVGAGRFPLATSVGEALADALASGEPYPLDTLLLYYANPAYAWLNPERWRKALAAAPFIASFTPFLDETSAAFADLILPDHSYLERFEDAAPAPATGAAIFGIRQPVVEPLHATRSTGDVVIELARALGGSVGEAFPWKDFRAAVLRRVSGLQAADRGSITAADAKKFSAALLRERVWTDASVRFESWREVFATPSGRFEFFSQRIWSELEAAAAAQRKSVAQLLAEWGHAGDPELACLPHHRELELVGNAESYPLVLEPFKPGTYAQGSGANLPLLQELTTEPGARPWVTAASLEPRTAESLGIRHGDRIAIESPVGRIELPVTIWPGVRPGCVRVPQGSGHTAFGRFAKGRGANVMEILAAEIDPLGGIPAVLGTRVRVTRIES